MKEHTYFAAIYLRLSRDDGDIDGSAKAESNSISSQREMARSFVRGHEDMELFDIYVEMKIANLIQRAGTEYRKNRRNKGFRHIYCVRKPLLISDVAAGCWKAH